MVRTWFEFGSWLVHGCFRFLGGTYRPRSSSLFSVIHGFLESGAGSGSSLALMRVLGLGLVSALTATRRGWVEGTDGLETAGEIEASSDSNAGLSFTIIVIAFVFVFSLANAVVAEIFIVLARTGTAAGPAVHLACIVAGFTRQTTDTAESGGCIGDSFAGTGAGPVHRRGTRAHHLLIISFSTTTVSTLTLDRARIEHRSDRGASQETGSARRHETAPEAAVRACWARVRGHEFAGGHQR